MIWKIKSLAPSEFINQFPEYSPQELSLLYSRGLKTQEQVDEFFNLDYTDLLDPFLMLGVKEAVKVIKKAIEKKKKFAVFGDYDCDGVCGAVILKTVLELLGADLDDRVYIPDRINEGYGLNIGAVKKMAEQKVELILTVDCGISDVEEIELANSLGMEVIIVDHHRVGKKLPMAKVIIDPWQKKDKYIFKELAGAGVAFKLAQALVRDEAEIKEGWEKWLLELVALATVADCMPLLGENRILVRYGLIVLAQTRRIGLQELMKIASLNPIFEVEKLKTNLDTYSLGFVLAPRLNAAGRVEHASLAFELLTEKNRQEAQILAQKINEHNKTRQKITDKIVSEIEGRIKGVLNDKQNPVIVESSLDWSPGVIGLAAGKIADRFYRPVFIFKEKDGDLRGSARSIAGFNIVEAIAQCSDLVKEFGGHSGAAGLSLKLKNLPAFKEKINSIAKEKIREEDLAVVLEVDSELGPEEFNWKLYDNLEKFEPFGKGNERPIFVSRNLEVISKKVVGNGSKHLKLELKSGKMKNKIFKAIGFRLADGNGDLKIGDKIDLAFEIIADEWNGNRELQMKIIDLKK